MKQRMIICWIALVALILTCTGLAEGTGETAMDYRTGESDIPDRGRLMDITIQIGERRYTRLGHIVDKSPVELRELLGQEDVTITISVE